ncbi:DUF7344 domain-containing protein [Halalkalicoccus ordinarius]|uniref:DUF7344 domain-containing protein n=1 Tax=Halalkalicoccus ordinarius TaxID=3116651 RepID=UPI00300F41DB
MYLETGETTRKKQMKRDIGRDESNNGSLSKDEIFYLLQNSRRRQALQMLLETNGTVEMGEMAEQIAAWEQGIAVDDIQSEQRQRVYIALYQSHLPKLVEYGLVSYDRSHGTVKQTPEIDQVISYLQDKESTGQRDGRMQKWIVVYGAITGVSISLIGLAWLAIGPISLLVDVGLGLVVTLLYASATIAMIADEYGSPI